MRNENSKTNKGGYTISKKRVYPCICSNCNKNFDGPANGTKFCSDECKLESRIKEHPNKGLCLQCNAKIDDKKILNRSKFCSISCSSKYNNAHRTQEENARIAEICRQSQKQIMSDRKDGIISETKTKHKTIIIDGIKHWRKNCSRCDKEFLSKKNQRPYFCCEKCEREYFLEKNNSTGFCAFCNDPLSLNDIKSRSLCCSYECSSNYRWSVMSEEDKIKRSENIRNSILNRDEETARNRKNKISLAWSEKSQEEINEIAKNRSDTLLLKTGYKGANANPIAKAKVQEKWKNKSDDEIKRIATERKISLEKNTGYTHPLLNPKTLEELRKRKYEEGSWIPLENKTDMEYYYMIVKTLTEKQFHKHFYEIPFSRLRGKDFHLDHIFSIFEGFKNNIPPFYIAHFSNLRIIKGSENMSKQQRCDKTLDELFEDYIKYENLNED